MPPLTTADLDQAYAEQHALCHLRQWRGDAVVGYKVGCASTVSQRRLKLKGPVFGRLFHSGRWPSGTTMPLTRFSSLAVEGELAVRLVKDVSAANVSPARLRSAIDSVFAVLELHDFAFPHKPSATDIVANNAVHAGFVYATDVGAPLDDEPASLRVEVNDAVVGQVSGSQLTATVADSVRWLGGELQRHGLRLHAGQTVLCGSLVPLTPIEKPCRLSVATDRFGSVACRFEEQGELTTPLR